MDASCSGREDLLSISSLNLMAGNEPDTAFRNSSDTPALLVHGFRVFPKTFVLVRNHESETKYANHLILPVEKSMPDLKTNRDQFCKTEFGQLPCERVMAGMQHGSSNNSKAQRCQEQFCKLSV